MSGTPYTIGRIGLVIRGAYSDAASYNVLDVVQYDDSSYVCFAACTGIPPIDPQHWMLLAQGATHITHLSADVIDSGTLKVDHLLVTGADSIVYEINATSSGLSASQLTDEQYRQRISGSALVAQSVTADQIAAHTIKADNVDIGDLFAAAATINALKTAVMSSIKFGGNNLLLNSAFEFGTTGWSVLDWQGVGMNKSCVIREKGSSQWVPAEANVLEFRATSETGAYGWQQFVGGLTKYTDYTFSGYIRQDRMTDKVVVIVSDTIDWINDVYVNMNAPTGTDYTSLSGYNRFSYTFNTGNYSNLRFAIVGHNYTGDGVIWITRLQLEQGETATAWAPSREEVKIGSAVYMNEDGIVIDGAKFSVNASGTDGDMSLSARGLVVPVIDSPSVQKRYTGPQALYINKAATDEQVMSGSHFRSFAAFADAISGKCIPSTLYVSVTNDTYYEGYVELYGVTGRGMIIFVGNGATFANTEILLESMTVQVLFYGLNMTQRNGGDRCVYVMNCMYAYFENCIFTAQSGATTYQCAILVDRGSNAAIQGCEAYNWGKSWHIAGVSTAKISATKGNCHPLVDSSFVLFVDSQACNVTPFSYDGWGGSSITLTNISVNQGSAAPAVAPTTTATFDASITHTVYGSAEWPGTWKSITNEIWQGYTDSQKYQVALMWFRTLGSLAGKTILSAKLRLRRVPAIGKGDDVKLIGYYGARAYGNGSGSPTGPISMGTIGTIGNDGDVHEFAIPTAAISYIATNPDGRCLALNPSDSALMSGHNYSSNYAKFSGVGSGYALQLVVTYNP